MQQIGQGVCRCGASSYCMVAVSNISHVNVCYVDHCDSAAQASFQPQAGTGNKYTASRSFSLIACRSSWTKLPIHLISPVWQCKSGMVCPCQSATCKPSKAAECRLCADGQLQTPCRPSCFGAYANTTLASCMGTILLHKDLLLLCCDRTWSIQKAGCHPLQFTHCAPNRYSIQLRCSLINLEECNVMHGVEVTRWTG